MPARVERVGRRSVDQYTQGGFNTLTSSRSGEIYEVVLYFGIIDILQDYDITKKLEHAYKSLQVDPTSISAVDPKLYSKRFRDFVGRIFIEDRWVDAARKFESCSKHSTRKGAGCLHFLKGAKIFVNRLPLMEEVSYFCTWKWWGWRKLVFFLGHFFFWVCAPRNVKEDLKDRHWEMSSRLFPPRKKKKKIQKYWRWGFK